MYRRDTQDGFIRGCLTLIGLIIWLVLIMVTIFWLTAKLESLREVLRNV